MGRQNPSLVIMAEGMGSRFGGLKQIEPVDPEGTSSLIFPCLTHGAPVSAMWCSSSSARWKENSVSGSATAWNGISMSPMSFRSWSVCRRAFPSRPDAPGHGHRPCAGLLQGRGKRPVRRHQRGRFLWPDGFLIFWPHRRTRAAMLTAMRCRHKLTRLATAPIYNSYNYIPIL